MTMPEETNWVKFHKLIGPKPASDKIVILCNGKIEQKGPLQSLYHRLVTAFMANLIEVLIMEAVFRGEDGRQQFGLGDVETNVAEGDQPSLPRGSVKIPL